MFKVPEQYRVKSGFLGSDKSYGNNGFFELPRHKITLNCICTDGEGWEHVSVSLSTREKFPKPIQRCATWEEMCFVKNNFWSDDDAVIQIHPKLEDYVNCHPYVLHLWKPIGKEIPLPPKELVGGV